MLRRDLFHLPTAALGLSLPAALVPPADSLDITTNGAVPDGKTLSTAAIQRTIDIAAQRGGGLVYIPPGTFLTGGLILRSYITLYLAAGATLLGSTRWDDYTPQPGPSAEGDANSRHLIFARDAENLSILGTGTIDGQGPTFWKSANRPPVPPEDQWKDVLQFDYLATPRRPAPMLEFVSCRNLRIEGITIQNAPSWTLRPVDCDTVYLRALRIRNPAFGPNTDGLDITASRNVFLSDCDISCGDDAICIKSENPYGPTRPTANITITNCVLTTCCNGFKIGTATHGEIENIVFTNSVIYNKDGPINERVIAGLAIEMVDGGTIDGILIQNIRMRNTRTPIFIRLGTRKATRAGQPPTHLRNLRISNIDAVGAVYTSSITGVPGHNVQDITLENIRISSTERGLAAWIDNTVPEHEDQYPEARMFDRLPAHGLYVRHAERIRLHNLELITEQGDARPCLAADDVEDLLLSGLESSPVQGQNPLVALHNTRRAHLRNNRAPGATACFLSVTGPQSEKITLQSNDLTEAELPIKLAPEVSPKAVRQL